MLLSVLTDIAAGRPKATAPVAPRITLARKAEAPTLLQPAPVNLPAATPPAPPPPPPPAPEPVAAPMPAVRVRTRPVAVSAPPPPPVAPVIARVPPPMPILPEKMVSSQVELQDRIPQRSRISRPGYSHVSSLIGACDRQHALAKRFDVEIMEAATGGHKVMWEIGRAVEKRVRKSYMLSRNYEGVYGDWRCFCERVERVGYMPAGLKCQHCNTNVDFYHEPVLVCEDAKVIGSPDMTIVLEDHYFVPVETKSMNKEQFDKITAPLPDHVNQAAMYRHLYSIAGAAVHDKVVIHYTMKEFKWGSPYKEFHVDCTTPLIVAMVEETLATGRRIANAVQTNTLPQRRCCQTASNPKAKACPVAHLCFQMSND